MSLALATCAHNYQECSHYYIQTTLGPKFATSNGGNVGFLFCFLHEIREDLVIWEQGFPNASFGSNRDGPNVLMMNKWEGKRGRDGRKWSEKSPWVVGRAATAISIA